MSAAVSVFSGGSGSRAVLRTAAKRKEGDPMAGLRRGVVGLVVFLAGAAAGGAAVLAWEHGPRLLHRPPPAAGEPPRRWEATLYLPAAGNDGRRFSDEAWQEAVAVLVDRFGGATLAGEQEGWWVDRDGRLRREPVRPVVVSFDRHRLGEFRDLVREVGRRLGQDQMYVRLDEPRVETLPVGAGNSGKDP
jgi:hypothetical protein